MQSGLRGRGCLGICAVGLVWFRSLVVVPRRNGVLLVLFLLSVRFGIGFQQRFIGEEQFLVVGFVGGA